MTAWRAMEELQREGRVRLLGVSNVTANQLTALCRFALQLGMTCLTGTTDPDHMGQDLSLHDFELSEDEMQVMAELA